jgi:autotransporter-associated beta strand protein
MSAKRVLSAVLAAGFLWTAAAPQAGATTCYFSTVDGSLIGDYAIAENWTPNWPVTGDQATIQSDYTATLAADVSSVHPASLTIGSAGTGELDVTTGGWLKVDSLVLCNWGSAGTLTQNGGQVNVINEMDVGVGGNAFVVQTGGALSASTLVVDYFGHGTYTLGGGTVTVSSTTWIGKEGAIDGAFNQTGGLFNNNSLLVAHAGGSGSLVITGGTANVSGACTITDTGSDVCTGKVTVAGNGVLNVTGDVNVGHNTVAGSAGYLYIQDSATCNTGYLYIAERPNSEGHVIQTGGVLNAAGAIKVGQNSIGTYDLSGGSAVASSKRSIIVGGETAGIGGSAGTLTVSGGSMYTVYDAGLVYKERGLFVGYFNHGVVNQSGGTITANADTLGDVWLGGYAYSAGALGTTLTGDGTYNLSGTGQLFTKSLCVGYSGPGTFKQDGGVVTTSAGGFYIRSGSSSAISTDFGTGCSVVIGGPSTTIYYSDGSIGAVSPGTGTYTLNAGTLNVVAGTGIAVGYLGAGTLNLNGGVVNLNAGSIKSGTGVGAAAAFNFSGGTLKNLKTVSMPIALVSGGTGAIFQEDTGYSGTVSGKIRNEDVVWGGGGLTKTGGGTLYFTGANRYNGVVVIKGGVLDLAQDAQDDVTGMADIWAGKLIFDYSISGYPPTGDDPALQIEAVLKASHDAGWTYAATHPIGSTTAAADSTHSHALGWLDDTASLKVDIMFTLYGDSNLDGTVNGADLNTVLSNYNLTHMHWSQGDFNYDGTVNGTDLNMVLSNYNQSLGLGAAVPEPSTLLLTAAGLMGLLAYAWRKRK